MNQLQLYICNDFAVGTELCDPCDPDEDICDGELVCSSDTYRCECPTGQVQIGDDCCKY
jgi:hypothetical protein